MTKDEEIAILRQNVRELQEQLQNALKRIAKLTEDNKL